MTTERTIQIRIDQTGDAQKGIDTLSGKLGGLGAVAGGVALGGIALLGAGLVTSTQAAMEAEAGQAELQAVLASTGGKAGVTADQVNGLASAFQATTKFSDDTILAGQNMLLTFTNIGTNVFPQATEAMLNMGEKFGSVDQAAIQLGKALNDPIAGVGALRRVGVTLTEAQEALIQKFVEAGNIEAAQKIILDELQTEFGGLAEAAGSTTAGSIERLNNKFGDLQEKIGAGVTPILNALLPVFDAFLDEIQVVGEQALPVINDALTRMAQAFGYDTKEVTATDAIVKSFKMVLDAVIVAIKLATITLSLMADAVEFNKRMWDNLKGMVNSVGHTFSVVMDGIRHNVSVAVDKWRDFRNAVRDAVDVIPDWLLPGSPTAFEIGLRGVANAAGEVAQKLPPAFAVQTPVASSNNGTATTQLIVQYQPMVSTASQIEIERNLIPLILEGLRKRGVRVV